MCHLRCRGDYIESATDSASGTYIPLHPLYHLYFQCYYCYVCLLMMLLLRIHGTVGKLYNPDGTLLTEHGTHCTPYILYTYTY